MKLNLNTPTHYESLSKYPEFRNAVFSIVAETLEKINNKSELIVSSMPYKNQFLLEEVIKELTRSI